MSSPQPTDQQKRQNRRLMWILLAMAALSFALTLWKFRPL